MQKLKFLVDENLGFALAKWLENKGFDVNAIILTMAGSSDEDVLEKAFSENRILITNDKDFGEKIFAKKMQHCGVILLRLQIETKENKIKVLENLLKSNIDNLSCNYIVVTESKIKIRKPSIH